MNDEIPLIDPQIANRLEIHAAYEAAFSGDVGTRVLRHLVENFVFKSSFTPGDPHTTSFNEGRRAVVLSIIREVNRDVFELYKLAEDRRNVR